MRTSGKNYSSLPELPPLTSKTVVAPLSPPPIARYDLLPAYCNYWPIIYPIAPYTRPYYAPYVSNFLII